MIAGLCRLTLVASALAGGDCIDDADALRARLRSQGAIHPGDLPATRPREPPVSIDLDSTICETYGLAKEGARHHLYRRPWLSPAAGHCRRHRRRARHFLRETVGRVRTPEPGDNSRCGPTAVSIPTPSSPSAAGWMSAPPARQPAQSSYPRRTGRPFLTGWTVPPMWPRPPTPPSRVRRTPRRCGSSSGG